MINEENPDYYPNPANNNPNDSSSDESEKLSPVFVVLLGLIAIVVIVVVVAIIWFVVSTGFFTSKSAMTCEDYGKLSEQERGSTIYSALIEEGYELDVDAGEVAGAFSLVKLKMGVDDYCGAEPFKEDVGATKNLSSPISIPVKEIASQMASNNPNNQ
ncbi:hypothetical protein [Varibaculum prostatecancerukia]|uniref:hypothetical protein n=1 Tax=Varibaculum prostatecancerukia TaxID=2811781 RepID=UPI001C0032C4|nr:hypothetical protein [Varibaculum prostatecancerukia]